MAERPISLLLSPTDMMRTSIWVSFLLISRTEYSTAPCGTGLYSKGSPLEKAQRTTSKYRSISSWGLDRKHIYIYIAEIRNTNDTYSTFDILRQINEYGAWDNKSVKEDVTRSFSIDERTITWPEFCNIKVITTEFRNISEQRTPNLLLRNQINYLQPLVTSDLDRSLLNFSPKESDSSKWEPTYMNTTSNVLHNSLSRLQEMQPSSRDLNDSQNSTWKSVLSFQLIWRGSNQKRI